MSSAQPPEQVQQLPLPSQNPILLTSAQEAQIRDIYHKRVRNFCADEIKSFVACAQHRTLSTTWACRNERRAMNACMLSRATREEQDAARQEWFATSEDRQREREERERRRIAQEKFHREWWGLKDPEKEGETGKKDQGQDKEERR